MTCSDAGAQLVCLCSVRTHQYAARPSPWPIIIFSSSVRSAESEGGIRGQTRLKQLPREGGVRMTQGSIIPPGISRRKVPWQRA